MPRLYPTVIAGLFILGTSTAAMADAKNKGNKDGPARAKATRSEAAKQLRAKPPGVPGKARAKAAEAREHGDHARAEREAEAAPGAQPETEGQPGATAAPAATAVPQLGLEERKQRAKDRAKNKHASRGKRAQATREARKDRSRKLLSRKGGDKGSVAALTQEYRRHARRKARLQRIEEIAAEADDKDTLDRVAKLLEHELQRHGKWIERFGNPQ